MSFVDCIKGHTILTDRQKQELIAEFEEKRMRYSKTMGDANAAEVAAVKFVEIKSAQLAQKARNTKRDLVAWKNVIQPQLKAEAARFDAERASATKGTKWLFGKSGMARAWRGKLEDTAIRQQAIERRSHLALGEIIEQYRARLGGLKQDTEGFLPVVEAVLGKQGNDGQANAAGQAIREVFDSLHRMYKQAGGVIGKIDNYWPQAHNPFLVGQKTFLEWRDAI